MNIYHKLLFDYEAHARIALLTVTDALGSNPSEIGLTMIIDEEGKVLEGSVGGGTIELEARRQGLDLLNKGRNGKITVEIREEEKGDGLHRHGRTVCSGFHPEG